MKRCTDNDTDRHIEHIALDGKFLEFSYDFHYLLWFLVCGSWPVCFAYIIRQSF
ncbi:unnamed protein product, partial [marine sediment metagenome]